MQLRRPLVQFRRDYLSGNSLISARRFLTLLRPGKTDLHPGTSAGRRGFFLHMFLHSRLVKFGRITLNDLQSTGRTLSDTSAKTVTEDIIHQFRFAVYDL